MPKPISSNTMMKTSYFFCLEITDFVRQQETASSTLLNLRDKALQTKHLCQPSVTCFPGTETHFCIERATPDFIIQQKSEIRSPSHEHSQHRMMVPGRGQQCCWAARLGACKERVGWGEKARERAPPAHQAGQHSGLTARKGQVFVNFPVNSFRWDF